MSNKELIRKAFDQVTFAMAELDTARLKLADLHYKAAKVEDTENVLNRISAVYEPSSDTHEAIFIQHQNAKSEFRDALDNKAKDIIVKSLGTAYNATSDAFSTLKKV